MAKTGLLLGLMLSTLSISYNAVAHTGMHHSSNMHSMLHIATSLAVSIALIAAGVFVFKRLPNAIKQRDKK